MTVRRRGALARRLTFAKHRRLIPVPILYTQKNTRSELRVFSQALRTVFKVSLSEVFEVYLVMRIKA
jgi:hypothetical protein